MVNFLDSVKSDPSFYRQLSVDDQLVTEFNCPLETQKQELWSNQGYFVYVIEGKKIWHVPGRAFELTPGQCVFVKKGAHIVEQVFGTTFCLIVFFVSDQFIINTLSGNPHAKFSETNSNAVSPISTIHADDSLHAFFGSMVPYFSNQHATNKILLELKFKELLLNVISNPKNLEATEYFYSLLTDTHAESMRKIMEENFLSNLHLEEYARLCARSLSAFKRDFEEYFKTTPGRWLLNRRLEYARVLINTSNKSVSEIAFESGFENASHFSRSYKERFGTSPASQRPVTA